MLTGTHAAWRASDSCPVAQAGVDLRTPECGSSNALERSYDPLSFSLGSFLIWRGSACLFIP